MPRGHVLGIRQLAAMRGTPEVVLELTIAAATKPVGDSLEIDADPPIKVRFEGGLEGDGASSTRVVNAIAPLMSTEPGLRSVLDLPLAVL